MGTAASRVIFAADLGSLSSREVPICLPQGALSVGNPKHRTLHSVLRGTAVFTDPFRKLKIPYPVLAAGPWEGVTLFLEPVEPGAGSQRQGGPSPPMMLTRDVGSLPHVSLSPTGTFISRRCQKRKNAPSF